MNPKTRSTLNEALPFLLLSFLALPTACGKNQVAETDHQPEPLATVKGELQLGTATVASSENIRIAIQWLPSDYFDEGNQTSPYDWTCTGQPFPEKIIHETNDRVPVITQSVEYIPQFPIRFEIPITNIPPKDALIDLQKLGGSGQLALGAVIAYYDTNGNGQFDYSSPGHLGEQIASDSAIHAHDLLWTDSYITYLDGMIPDTENSTSEAFTFTVPVPLPTGFAVLTNYFTENEETVRSEVTPLSNALFTLEMRTPNIYDYICGSTEYYDEFGGPMPEGAEPRCRRNNTWYNWAVPLDDGLDPCVTKSRSGGACLPENAEIPSDWPCQ